jgi:hypothetical protein
MIETILYRGFSIDITHDDFPLNPFRDWDGLPPLMYKSQHNNADFSDGQIKDYLSNYLTDTKLAYHQKTLCKMFSEDHNVFKDYILSDKLSEIRDMINDASFKEMTNFCVLFEIPHLHIQSTGYSQGDWADIFICTTESFLEENGDEPLRDEVMIDASKLFGYWAWGDIYGYEVYNLNEEHEIPCVSGFYGDCNEKNGLLDNARSSIDFHIKTSIKSWNKRLKQLIKARVPYHNRMVIAKEYSKWD